MKIRTKLMIFTNGPLPLECKNLHLLSNFDEIFYVKSFYECWLKIKTKCENFAYGGASLLLRLKFQNHKKIIFN